MTQEQEITPEQIKGGMRYLIAEKAFKQNPDFEAEAIRIDEITATGIIYKKNSQVSRSFSVTMDLT